MNLMVTGGAGFIGANFVRYWLATHPSDRVVVLDSLTYAGNFASIQDFADHPTFSFVHGDVCDGTLVASVLSEERISCVVHFAAESHVDRSITGPDEFIRTNVVGTHSILKACLAYWSRSGRLRTDVRFHHVSTDEVFGSLGLSDPAFTETTPYAPNSPYSASKAASDHLVRAYRHTYGLPVTVTNCSNNYGPYQFPEKLIPLTLLNAIAGRKLPVYGRGENVRDWLHVSDHCRAIDVVLARGELGQTYNVGGESERRNIAIVEQLCTELERRFIASPELREKYPHCPASQGERVSDLITFVQDRPGHDFRYAVDTGKIRRQLGFAPHLTFNDGLRSTVDWYLANERWWRAILDKSA